MRRNAENYTWVRTVNSKKIEGEGPGCVLQKDVINSKSHLGVEAEVFYLSHQASYAGNF